ncbi:MAG: methionyl-tRNA formyltransferase [Negativicutes bacterium]|nr:methionyl-tRNA formyltransferase [Negativicutes bacterium]
MSKMRVVFMGTPDFAVPCLEMLIAENYDIQAVITQPDRPKGRGQKVAPSPVKQAALVHNLPVLTLERIKDEAFITAMRRLNPDLIAVVAFGQFLPKTLLELPIYGCVNVHASLLPKYRGAAPIHWAVINGEKCTGVTTMFMDIGMDTGDMILKREVAIGDEETTGELHDKLKVAGAELLSATLAAIMAGTAPRCPQDHASATYAPLLTRTTERIDWQRPAGEIHNLVRGLNPWPVAYTLHGDKLLKVWRTRLGNPNAAGEPGRVAFSAEGIFVSTGRGELELLEVQPESKRRMSADDYFRGCGDAGHLTLK